MPCGPGCFKCKSEMFSGPVACEFLMFLMIFVVCGGLWRNESRDGIVELVAEFASCNTSFL